MSKRKRRLETRPHNAVDKRMRQWRACGVVTLVVVLSLVVAFVAMRLFHDDDHIHKPAPHGGIIVPVGDENDHYHIEAVVEEGGTFKLYTFGEEVDQVLEVESQELRVHVKQEGDAEPTPLVLMPMPQPADTEGKTTVFLGRLPCDLASRQLVVTVPHITIAGRKYHLNFTIANLALERDPAARTKEQEKLYLKPGGKYTEADIKANGTTTASRKYQAFQGTHDFAPKPGDKVCPVTRAKVHADFTWVVGGQVYKFCCPPCIDEFVRRAKEQPETIREPDEYVKK